MRTRRKRSRSGKNTILSTVLVGMSIAATAPIILNTLPVETTKLVSKIPSEQKTTKEETVQVRFNQTNQESQQEPIQVQKTVLTNKISRSGSEVETERYPRYDYSKLSCSTEFVKICEELAYKNGYDDIDVVYCIGSYECSFNPKQVTYNPNTYYKNGKIKKRGEYSVGWCQVNLWAHTSVTEAQMKDPRKNIQYMMSGDWKECLEAVKEKKLTGIDKIMYFVRHGQRPDLANPNTYNYIIKTIKKYYAELQDAKITNKQEYKTNSK